MIYEELTCSNLTKSVIVKLLYFLYLACRGLLNIVNKFSWTIFIWLFAVTCHTRFACMRNIIPREKMEEVFKFAI